MLRNKKIFLIGIIFIFAVFLFLRFYNLLALPIFNDEAIYLNWAKDIHFNWSDNKFTSLASITGKPPLHYWILALGYHWFGDPLYSGRFISILAAILSFWGVFLLTQKLFHSKLTTLIALSLYTFCPFVLLYERMVLADVFISAIGIYIFYFSWLIFSESEKNERPKNLRWVWPVIVLGLLFSLGRLFKQTILIFILVTGLILLWSILKNKFRFKQIIFLVSEFILAYGLSELICRLIIPTKLLAGSNFLASFFVFNFKEFSGSFLDAWFKNLRIIGEVFIKYFTWPILVVFIIGCFKNKFWRESKIQWLIFLIFFPLIIFVLISNIFYPRYFLFIAPFFIILIAFFIANFGRNLARFKYFKVTVCLLLFLLILAPSLYQDYQLLKNPLKFNWTKIDDDFVNQWSSGYAITKVGDYLAVNSKDDQVLFLDTSLGYPFAYLYLYEENLPYLKLAQINFNLAEYIEIARKTESIKPILILLNPDRRPEDREFEKSDICQNQKRFYQPNNINHYTLCFIN